MVTKSIYPKGNRKRRNSLLCLPADSVPLTALGAGLSPVGLCCHIPSAGTGTAAETQPLLHPITQCCSVKKTKKIQGEIRVLKSLLHSHFCCFLSLSLPWSISLHLDLPFKFTKMWFLLTKAWLLQNLAVHLESCSHRSRSWVRPHEEMIKKYTFCKETEQTNSNNNSKAYQRKSR